jgi:molecular chaperone GrpE
MNPNENDPTQDPTYANPAHGSTNGKTANPADNAGAGNFTDPPTAPGASGASSAPGAAGASSATADALSAEVRLAELEAKHAQVADAYLRAKAEAENTRRRAEEEIGKARKFAVESFAESLLPVCDSLEAAITIQSAKPEQMLEGVHATLRQLTAALERNKVVHINPPAGTRFDPHQHQAISVVPAEQDANTVVTVLQKGYLIADRVLRPALVTVAAPK